LAATVRLRVDDVGAVICSAACVDRPAASQHVAVHVIGVSARYFFDDDAAATACRCDPANEDDEVVSRRHRRGQLGYRN
jgi:hypothetical protein